ncbi:Rieske (2Fe-2S) domain-containing protein, partial [Saccharomonospora azurea SZMC 14600]
MVERRRTVRGLAAAAVRRWPESWPLRPLPRQDWARQRPTVGQADVAVIDAAVKRAQARPSG